MTFPRASETFFQAEYILNIENQTEARISGDDGFKLFNVHWMHIETCPQGDFPICINKKTVSSFSVSFCTLFDGI